MWRGGALPRNKSAVCPKVPGGRYQLGFLLSDRDFEQNFPVKVLSLHLTLRIEREAALKEYPTFPGSVVQS